MDGQDWLICDCCGTKTHKLWGWVHTPAATVLSYFVRWSDGHPEAGADFNLLMGKWGEGTSPEDRTCASLHLYRQEDGQWAFCVVDARADFFGPGMMAAHGLARDDVVGTELATHLFAIVDQIWLQDDRLPFPY